MLLSQGLTWYMRVTGWAYSASCHGTTAWLYRVAFRSQMFPLIGAGYVINDNVATSELQETVLRVYRLPETSSLSRHLTRAITELTILLPSDQKSRERSF
jgi:hypothetical protein